MAAQHANEVDEVIKDLKSYPGFGSYMIMNNDGIVIKYENMEYKRAVHQAHLVLDLCAKSKRYIRELFDPPDNEVESLRLKTKDYEMVVAQHGNFTLIVIQQSAEAKRRPDGEKDDAGAAPPTEKKD